MAGKLEKALWAMLLLVCAFCCQIQFLSQSHGSAEKNLVSVFVPERLRGFVAARLWEQADKYMHTGSSQKVPEQFSAGSYAGNTDLIPLVQIVTLLVPEELPPWKLLAENLGRHLGQKESAIRILQQAICKNRKSPGVHELYASAAALRIFTGKPDQNEKLSALKYLRAAISMFPADNRKTEDLSPGFNLEAYYVLSSRLYVELGRPKLSLDAWNKSGLPLDPSQGKLAMMLKEFHDKAVMPDPSKFSDQEDTTLAQPTKESPEKPDREIPAADRSILSLILVFSLFTCLLGLSFYNKKHQSILLHG